MNEQAMRQLLLDADAAAGSAPATSADLASSVRLRLRRRRQTRMAGMSVVLCALLAVGLFVRMNPRPAAVAVEKSANSREELLRARRSADSQAAMVNRLIQYQRSLDIRDKAARNLDRGQPLDRLQQQRENAARLLTHDGEYRRVIELFPETQWATVARRRLQT
jgi:hypothetical protein